MKPIARSSEGFTLLEVTVSISVIVIGVLALAGLLVSVNKQRTELHGRMRAAEEAQSMIEMIQLGNPDYLVANYDDRTYEVACSGTSGSCSGTGKHFTVHTTVDDTNDNLPMLLVDVSWDERGETRTVGYRTELYAPNGTSNFTTPELDDHITWDPDLDLVQTGSGPGPDPTPSVPPAPAVDPPPGKNGK